MLSIKLLLNLSGLYQFCLNVFLSCTGVLDGQACSWNKSLLIGESCNLQILQTRQLFGGNTTQVFLFYLVFMLDMLIIANIFIQGVCVNGMSSTMK